MRPGQIARSRSALLDQRFQGKVEAALATECFERSNDLINGSFGGGFKRCKYGDRRAVMSDDEALAPLVEGGRYVVQARSLVMLFSDLLAEPQPVYKALRRLRHRGHDVILFHVLDEAEARFPFDGMIEFEEPETRDKLQIDASGFRNEYLAEVQRFCEEYRRECMQTGVDYVGLNTSMPFDRALMEYLASRRARC